MATVLHIITGLGDGGAEAVLGRLVTCDGGSRHEVVSLSDRGVHGDRLMFAGIPVHTLDMRRGRVTVAGLVKLFQLLRAVNPDVVQTWMYHADLIGGLLARLAGRHAVVWGIRNAYPGARGNTMSTRLVARACALASHVVPERIVSCSTAGADAHIKYGYRASRIVVIPNGYDLATFAPDPAARRRLRTEFQASEGVVLLGMVARWDPHKDHANLIAALAQLQAGAPGAWRCVLVGEDITRDNRRLVSMLARYGVQDRVLLLGPRRDVPGIMNALDIHLLSSVGEAFPNVVAEAMACGTPCVATDVGDAATIVGATGWLVPPGAPGALAEAVRSAMVELGDCVRWPLRQASARQRIAERFSLERMVEAYWDTWQQVARAERLHHG